jgi:hypothetical protein
VSEDDFKAQAEVTQVLTLQLSEMTDRVDEQLKNLSRVGGEMNPSDMLQMQFMMNQTARLVEMSSSILSSFDTAVKSYLRNVK